MKKLLPLFLAFPFALFAQPNNNGKLDDVEEFTTKIEVPFTMPDGIKLMTDVYLPIVRDCLLVDVDAELLGFPVKGTIEIIRKGTQLLIYDSLDGQFIGDSILRYQMPMIFTRTPYNKAGNDASGAIFNMLGYAYAMQDMRGRYASEGVYLPMHSDSWNKNAGHSDFSHKGDVTSLTDPKNSNRHEDGYNSVKYMVDSLRMPASMNLPNSGELICNGSVGMFGASALGNTQLQAAAAHRIDPLVPGLKALLPIVATNQHYNATGFPNGVFRERIVTGWIKGQIVDLDDPEDILPLIDTEIQNNIHTAADYNLATKFVVAEATIDHFCCERYLGNKSGYYPNSKGRGEMDATRAPVDINGESVYRGKIVGGTVVNVGDSDPDGIIGFGSSVRPNLNYSRYTNPEVPVFHITGWWDIYPEGQIATWQQSMKHLSPANRKLQKIVIGPWAHQTIASRKTGDMRYPKNVTEITKFDIEDVDFDELPLSQVLESEFISWFRYTLNYNSYKTSHEPKFIIPESDRWQDLGDFFEIRIPSEDFIMTFEQMLNYLAAQTGLDGMRVELKSKITGDVLTVDVPEGVIPPASEPIIAGLTVDDTIQPPGYTWRDYANDIPAVRFYVQGNDSIDRANSGFSVGNYWFGADTFPIPKAVTNKKMYLHENGTLNWNKPTTDEGLGIYVHDPDDPVVTVGGGNMIVKTPQGDRNSQGPMNLADPNFAPYTMDRAGVLQYESAAITAANGYPGDSLCIIGYPIADIYAKSNPAGALSGPTNTEFYVRILDVYPDGREYFIVEGGVNARARNYARSLADGAPDDDAEFSNIDIGSVYGYKFKLMPIAHTWAKGHKVKILISSSNHPRYQSCPNLPIEDGDFFRRYPNDGKGYVYNGQLMYPRIAVQRVAFSPNWSTNVQLPVYEKVWNSIEDNELADNMASELDAMVFPNPTTNTFSVFMNKKSQYIGKLYNSIGQLIYEASFTELMQVDVSGYLQGIYFIEITNQNTSEKLVRKVSVI
ncbi:T9SS type A sorting domain-containing protein [Bacteroidales bacterium AH-315-I05]|nr:T9SS type A sorting domain-containing protein [Bacteroidales bacterium AH-315-I05]